MSKLTDNLDFGLVNSRIYRISIFKLDDEIVKGYHRNNYRLLSTKLISIFKQILSEFNLKTNQLQ